MSHHRRIDPLKKPTLASMVADRLRELIVEGGYEPGDQLNEVDLASRFGVSRGPIREGLRQLVHEGLLRSEPHRGAFVPNLTSSDIADVYNAREAIEAAAVRALFAGEGHAIVAADLAKIVQAMKRAFAGHEWARLAELDMRFHMELVQAAGSVRLSRMYSTLLDETRICLRMSASQPTRKDLVAEHVELAHLLEVGDVDGTLTALSRHLRDSVRTLTLNRAEATRSDGKGRVEALVSKPSMPDRPQPKARLS